MRYMAMTHSNWLEHAKAFRELYDSSPKPVRISFHFIRDSKRKFDYVNVAQLPLDLMQKYGWLPGDDADCIIPVFEPYLYDKENSGVWIELCLPSES